MSKAPIRLLVVDDSAYNRRNIADVFADDLPGIHFLGGVYKEDAAGGEVL